MFNHLSLLFFALIFLISGCDSSSTDMSSTGKAFNLATAQQQYANIELTVADIGEQSYQNGSALAVTLSTPLNPSEDFQDFFNVSHKADKAKGSWELSNSGLVVYFPHIKPAQSYTVEIMGGLTSATGKKLAKTVSNTVETRNREPQLRFASKGSVLPATLAKGLPIVTTNIKAATVDFYRVKSNQTHNFLSKWKGRSQQANYELDKYQEAVDLVYTGRFDFNPPQNKHFKTHLDLKSIDELQTAGIYLAVMKPVGSFNAEFQVTYFVVSDLGLHARMYRDKIAVQISALATGKALSGVEVTLYNKADEVLAKIKTDSEGQAHFSTHQEATYLLARQGNHLSVLKLNAPALDLSEFKIEGREQKPIEIFTYSPRNLYRPGETITFSAILRNADGQLLPSPPIKAVIKRADGQKIKYFTWHPQLTKQGYYQTEYTLPDNAMTGDWILELTTADKTYHHYKFKVEDFLPERMELLLGKHPSKENWTDHELALIIPVSGRYLYGAPAAKNRLSSKIFVKKNRHPIKSLNSYYFGLEDEKPNTSFEERNDITLDAQGRANLNIKSVWSDVKNSPLAIKVVSSLFETGGRPVTRAIKYTSWPQKTLMGIRPHIALSDIPDSSEISFDIIKTTSKGVLQGKTEVVAKLIKEQRDYYWEYSNSQGWHSEHTDKSYPVFEKRFDLNANKAVTLKVPVEWGSYLLMLEDETTGQQSSIRFYAGSGWHEQENNQSARPDRIVLELDKKNYLANETLKLKITSPYSGNGFIAVENGDEQLWFKRLDLSAKGNVVEIPIKKAWARHDLYISAVAFKAGDSKQQITPNRAVGIIHLPLNRSERQLNVSINAPQKMIRPETTLQTEVKITGATAGQKTYVTLAAVDVGVLNITNYKTPNPFDWFFEPHRYSVDQRDIYNKIIELVQGDVTKARFGGDADDDKHAGGARPDSKIKIVSLFSGVVETNAQGMAKIDLKIPDFNGRLRLMAVAFNDHQFGAADATVTVSAPVIAEVSLPRFLAAGDQAELTLDLRNQSGEIQNLTVNFSSTSPVKLIHNNPLTVVLKAKQKQVIRLPIIAENAFGQARIQLQLKNATSAKEVIDLKRQWFLGVRPAYPAKSSMQRRIIHPDKSAKIHSQMVGLLASSATAGLTISSQPPIAIKSHLKQLLQYPYGCLEQTISSTYPWLSINENNTNEWGLSRVLINNKPFNINNKTRTIERSISRIAGMQRSNGSFGLWSNNDREEHWLTAYAVDFLLDAKEEGASVPQEMLDKALKRLAEYLNQRGNMYGQGYSQYPKHASFAYKAYAAYVLSRVNRAPLGSLRTLYDHHRKTVKSGLPLIHLGIALVNQGDQVKGKQAINLGINKPRNDYFYLGDYGSRLRDLTLINYLLNKHPIVPKLTANLIFQLGDELAHRDYLSTQEKNALFRTGVLLKNKPQQAWQGELILNQTVRKLAQKGRYNEQFKGADIPQSVNFISSAEIPLYLQYGVQAYSRTAPRMQMDTIQIERNYYNLDGQLIDLQKVKSGEVLLVHLNVNAIRRIKDALVIDLIPAGFEIENQNLENSLKIESFKIGEDSIEKLQNATNKKYQQYLDDRYIAAIDLYKNRPQHAFYLIRAVTKGAFVNPPPYVEDMYRPYIRAIGRTFANVEIW
ncbi:MAG: alpha-2-macroglobulin family protein [Methylococcales bacterium]|nr:alpha-2-macroglobulin family protein [Methylococcales bacterium]